MTVTPAKPCDLLHLAQDLAREVARAGEEIGLPYIAVSADIGDPEPMRGPDGLPFAVTIFRWIDPDLRYWEDRGFALRSALVHASRCCAEPFWFRNRRFGSWRPNGALRALEEAGATDTFGVGTAIVAPAHLPGGVIGAVVWASPDTSLDVETTFAAWAERLHGLAFRFIGAYDEAVGGVPSAVPARLTRREIQCLKWAAAGKTDAEIGGIVGISLPTVRFHLGNAARKLGVGGRSQAIQHAAALGYIGADPRPRQVGAPAG
ncbi:MAG: LuxR C-terminal-related transcriptional regulator [Phenylobacterium sp.]|jgi:DNA-binding CsgD family transcriptional regulator|uniref:helix-turn-helix transcriptional regulator n=1 Tax=Phenylobacterium sp. TaxID=1871053 RepID=UPI002A2C1D38|nr:LuxR C-terminal-related transcriptional regulator [Phenylobacterium sp.]MDD3838124.1 LuxR C-terminal-related transcriptional regulator [Phenylobacterium sp.]MDX9996357.1 LuxR C-terminal-related transcriptional regulator [Phenylobacterium sp.]